MHKPMKFLPIEPEIPINKEAYVKLFFFLAMFRGVAFDSGRNIQTWPKKITAGFQYSTTKREVAKF